ncbi:MAG: glycine cleavage system aminomethyltransferase GcvT [Myxococcota bacterium]|nr:glycine cleavage system aminomethyltransferase GcvT [Myxococcota bacterium]
MSNHTPLHAEHLALGARMVDFGGWDMPVQYSGASAEHEAVRNGVGMFDVSHMGEVWLRGEQAVVAIDSLVTNSVAGLPNGKACYAGMLNQEGGFIDDLIVYRFAEDEIFICLNASNAAKDIAWMRQHLGDSVEVVDACADFGQIAVQGPLAVELVAGLSSHDLAAMQPFEMAKVSLAGVEGVIAARTGYTGEDGFELYIPAGHTAELWRALLKAGVTPCGLGARDSLRLEMKYALYGNDIDASTNPIEAGLGWVCKDKIKDFIGAEAVRQMRAEKPKRKLVGLLLEGRRVARSGSPVVNDQGEAVGRITSGAFSPSLKKSIALAMVPIGLAKVDTQVGVDIRGRVHAAQVVKTPFYRV